MIEKTDWVQKEYKVVLEEETLIQYSNEISLEEIIRAGVFALRATNRIVLEEVECIDGGF